MIIILRKSHDSSRQAEEGWIRSRDHSDSTAFLGVEISISKPENLKQLKVCKATAFTTTITYNFLLLVAHTHFRILASSPKSGGDWGWCARNTCAPTFSPFIQLIVCELNPNINMISTPGTGPTNIFCFFVG